MLTQYTNIDNILNADESLSGDRIQKKHKNLLQYNNIPVKFIPSISTDYGCEFHVYSNDEWLTGNHNLQLVDPLPEYKDKITNQPIQFTNQPLAIDLYNEFYQLNLLAGQYRVIINFFDSYIGNYDAPSLKIDEISPDRTEVRLKVIDSDSIITKHEFRNWINNVNLTAIPTTNERFLLNFSRNKTAVIVNSVIRGQYLYVKLYEPLDKLIEKDFTCWVVRELKPPYIDLVSIIPKSVDETVNVLSGPNWYAYNSYEISSETGLKNWNDLLGSSIRTSQEIVDSYFSGSLSGIKLNIDYTDFNNFIFYSSATERLENFRYKLNLLELYAQQSSSILELSGSVATTNAIDYENNRTKLIGSFDDFEQHLFYKSSSALFSNEIPAVNPNVGFITGSYITDAPKSNSTYPYTLYSISSSQFINWFDGVLDSASVYDNRNTNALLNTVPTHLLQDRENNGLTTFVNMLGQHYDILYTYINAMTKINNREEHPQLGMPNELLYSVAKQFGWNLADGNQYQELWEYVLGTSEAGIPLTGSNSVGEPAVSGKDMTYHVWRRIVNNLPGLLKSKGTKRSIQALLACYGIPQSLISINEYGGPRIDRAPIYEKLNFDYALDLISNPAGTVTVNYDQPIDSIELRFRTDNIITNPTMPSTMNLYSVGSNEVTIDFSRGNLGTININGTASAEIECFDGEWVNTILRTGSYVSGIGMVYGSGAYGSGTYGSGTPGGLLELVAKKSKWGKIVATVSASATASLPTTGTVSLGTAGTETRLYGELQELRLWTGSLLDPAFINHTKAPAAYDGNVDAYDELAFRLPLTQKINHTLTSSLPGVEPNPTGISASFASWTTSTPYDSIEETYYYDAISLGIGTFDDNKIRLESNELIGTLDVATRGERSQYDKAPLDSKKLGVYYSPETMIDEDIIAQLGFQRLDDYIGDPGDVNSRSYPDLIQEAENYWKKYNTKNDINAYLKIFSLYDLSFFSQLEQLLPARADKITGVLIQPNILERSKDVALPSVGRELITYNTNPIQTINNVLSGSYPYYSGELSGKILTITAIDDDQLNGYLTSSEANAYNSMSYSQTNVIRSGSVWIDSTVTFAGTLPTITGSRLSEFRQIEYLPDVYIPAQFQDYLPAGLNNQRYFGSKITSAAFNVNSTQTVDGGPVVEWSVANPNQLIYQPLGQQGNFSLQGQVNTTLPLQTTTPAPNASTTNQATQTI